MKISRNIIATVLSLALIWGVVAAGQLEQFDKDLAAHYGVEIEQLQDYRELGLGESDLVVLLEIGCLSGASTESVLDERLKGRSWYNILSEFDLTSADLYVEAPHEISSPAYLPIYAKYRVTPRAQWELISLSDDDIRMLANLRFLTEFHTYSPYQVMAMVDYGKSFVTINNQIVKTMAELDSGGQNSVK